MMDGWMPNWVEGRFCGRKGCSIGWRDVSVGEKDTGLGY
jgi:hypothetical protein